jgi:hypothetical protein
MKTIAFFYRFGGITHNCENSEKVREDGEYADQVRIEYMLVNVRRGKEVGGHRVNIDLLI